jgi:hypothetical protein
VAWIVLGITALCAWLEGGRRGLVLDLLRLGVALGLVASGYWFGATLDRAAQIALALLLLASAAAAIAVAARGPATATAQA